MAVLSDDIFAQLEQWNQRTNQAAGDVDPATAGHLDQYAQHYWWMDPGAMFSLARAGIGVTDPAAQAAAVSAAHLQAGGMGFAPIGAPVTKPAGEVDTTGVFAKLDQMQQQTPATQLSSSIRPAGSHSAGGIGLGNALGQSPPAERLIGIPQWAKLSDDQQRELSGLTFAASATDPNTYTVAGLENLSPGTRDVFHRQLASGDLALQARIGGPWALGNPYDAVGNKKSQQMIDLELRTSADRPEYQGANTITFSTSPMHQNQGAAEQLLGVAGGTPVLGSALRAATTGLSAPYQEVQGVMRDLHQVLYEHELPNFESQSDLGVVAGDWLHGRPVDLGTGPFAGGQVHQELERRQLLRGNIHGEGITAGRWFADALPDSVLGKHINEPGSNEYKLLSGAVDTASAVVLDPTAWGLKGLGASREAATLFHGEGSVTQAVNAYRTTGEVLPALRTFQEAGGLSGLRGTTSMDAVNQWVDAPERLPFHDAGAAQTDTYSTWINFKRQAPPNVAAQLADTSTPAEFADTLRPYLGAYIREKPTLNDMVGARTGQLGISAPGADIQLLQAPVPSKWVSMMPNSAVASDSLQANAVQMERWATVAKVPDDKFRPLFDEMARTTSPIERRNVWAKLFRIPEDELVAKGVPVEQARRLTRMNQANETAQGIYATREVELGRGTLDNQMVLDGGPLFIADNQPTFLAQTLNQNILLPDARALRRALSKAAPILLNPKVQGAEHLLTSAQGVWKQLQISTVKTMIKVLGDEGLSISARGYESMLSAHPVSALSTILATPLGELAADAGYFARLRNVTAKGMRWGAEHVPGVDPEGTIRAGVSSEGAIPFEQMSELQTVLGRGLDTINNDRLGILHAPDWRILPRQPGVNDEAFLQAFGRHFAQYAASPDTRGLARGATLQEAQEAYFTGPLSKYREQLMESRPDLALDTRAGSDAQVVKLLEQMRTVTNGNPALTEAIQTGRLDGTTIWEASHDGSPRLNDNYYRKLSAYQDDFPTSTPQQKAIFSRDVARRQIADNMFGNAVHLLLSVPSAVLSKSPLFRQAYWERIIDNAPFMTADAQNEALRIAQGEANIGKGLTAELKRAVTQGNRQREPFSGALTIDQADQIAKGHALDMVRTTTHEFSERNQGMDMLRLLTPFGEVWRKTIKRWANIINENPAVVRRGLQGYQALQSPDLGQVLGAPSIPGPDGTPVQQGFFHTDSNGQEVFTIPGSEWATQALTGVPVPFSGAVKGLSLGTEFFPSLGPVASIPVAWSLQQVHAAPSVTETLFPYGAPTDVSDLWNYAPNWMRRAFGADRATSPDSVRAFNYSVIDVIRYGITNGDYDTSTSAGIQHAVEDATNKAHTLAKIRGAANFLIPGAPSPQFLVRDKTGKLIDASILIDEYRKLSDADPNTAGQKFLAAYGVDVFKAMTSKSYAYVFGIPTSADSVKWVDDHASIKTDFPHIYGYFAPPSDPTKFDYQTYVDQLQPGGGRQALTPDQWAKVANSRAAALQYGHYRDMVDEANGGKPASDNQRAWLANVKANLMKQYPGYEEALYGGNALPQRPSPKVLTDEAQAALNDPTIKSTEAGQGMVSYLSVQAKVEEAWAKAGYAPGTWQNANGDWAIQLRAYMRQIAVNVEASHPQFGPLFEDVFGRAMRIDTDPRALTPGG